MKESMSLEERNYFKALGARMAKRRKAVGLTQEEMAEALHIVQQTYAAYETGRHRVPIFLLLPIARILGTETDYLLGEAVVDAKRGLAPKLQRALENLGRLNKPEREMILGALEGLADGREARRRKRKNAE